MAHPNEDLARRGYEAFAKGDLDTLNSLMTDDLVWHVPVETPFRAITRERTLCCHGGEPRRATR